MAANVSARKLRSEILAALADDYRHAFLAVECGGAGCARGRVYPVAGFAGVFPGARVGQVVARMRCGTCDGALVSARLHTEPALRGRWVELVGPSAQGPRRD